MNRSLVIDIAVALVLKLINRGHIELVWLVSWRGVLAASLWFSRYYKPLLLTAIAIEVTVILWIQVMR